MPHAGAHSKLYGRRKGKRLRAGQARLLQTLLPALRIDPDAEETRDPASLFPFAPHDIWLEIGFGGGEHLVWQARDHPGTGVIGCEPFVNGVAKALRQIEDAGVHNVRLFDDDARLLIERFAPCSISRVFLLFPDPWPKRAHAKRRFVAQASLRQLHRIMRPGAELRIASDIAGYIAWTLVQMRRHGGFRWLAETPCDWRRRPADWPATRYEQKAGRQGRAPVFLRFVKH